MIGFSSLDGKRHPVERNGFALAEQPRQHRLFSRGGSARLGLRIVSRANTEGQVQG